MFDKIVNETLNFVFGEAEDNKEEPPHWEKRIVFILLFIIVIFVLYLELEEKAF